MKGHAGRKASEKEKLNTCKKEQEGTIQMIIYY